MGLTRFHKILFLLCFLVTTGEGYNIFLYGAVLPLLAAEWGLSAAAAGMVGSSRC
ncbi:MAG: hypothetical protein LBK56_13775 [Gracilibacteraceae bacterium]|jgi:AAHS family benzoate transporter-like MFS transporter|nr:hypothetical protein [Gracilibacteraceae bacterium]